MRGGALLLAGLQRGQSAAVQRHVGIGGIGLQALPDHEYGFAVRISACSEKGDIGSKCYIAGDLLPGEVQGVRGKPHVFAAAGDRVSPCGGIIFDGTGVQNDADIRVVPQTARTAALRPRGRGAARKRAAKSPSRTVAMVCA